MRDLTVGTVLSRRREWGQGMYLGTGEAAAGEVAGAARVSKCSLWMGDVCVRSSLWGARLRAFSEGSILINLSCISLPPRSGSSQLYMFNSPHTSSLARSYAGSQERCQSWEECFLHVYFLGMYHLSLAASLNRMPHTSNATVRSFQVHSMEPSSQTGCTSNPLSHPLYDVRIRKGVKIMENIALSLFLLTVSF